MKKKNQEYTTAQILGAFRKELIAEGFDETSAEVTALSYFSCVSSYDDFQLEVDEDLIQIQQKDEKKGESDAN